MTKLRVFAVLPVLLFALFGLGGAALAQEGETTTPAVDDPPAPPVEVPDDGSATDSAGTSYEFDSITGNITILQDSVIVIVNNINVDDVPVDDVPPVDDGTEPPVDDGTGDVDSAADDGAADDGAADDGTADDGTVDDGTTDDDAVDDGTPDDGAVDDGATDDGAVDDGTADDGADMDDGATDDAFGDAVEGVESTLTDRGTRAPIFDQLD